jgi:hypothetical protein
MSSRAAAPMWPGTSDSLMRRLMAEINAFRTGTEATKAAYTAAEEGQRPYGTGSQVVPP